MTVTSLDDERAKRAGGVQGPVRCLGCGHNWFAVYPTGTPELMCPECGTERGVPMSLLEPADGVFRFCCGACDGDLFFVLVDGAQCAKCGGTVSYRQLAELAP